MKDGRLSLLLASVQSVATGLGGQLLLLISGPLIARMLGVDGRGYFAGLGLWPTLFASLGNLGVPLACTYYLSERPEQASKIVGQACRIALVQIVILTLLLTATLFFWSRGKPAELRLAVYPILLMIPAIMTQQYALAIIQGLQQFTAMNVAYLLPLVFYVLNVGILFILGEQSLLSVVIGWVLAYVFAAIISTVMVLKRLHIDWWGNAPDLRRQLITFGLRGHLGNVSPVDGLRIDQVAIALFLSPAALGLYVVACAFINPLRFIGVSIGKVAYPAIAKRHGTVSARRLVWLFFGGGTVLNLLVAALLIVGTPILLPRLFGPEFSPAVSVAQVLLIGTVLMTSRRILVEGLSGLKYPQVSTIAELSMYPWLVIGGPLLTTRYGIGGLAVALAIGYGLSLAVAVIVGLRLALRPALSVIPLIPSGVECAAVAISGTSAIKE